MSAIASAKHRRAARAAEPARTALIGIVIPVHNEERKLAGCLRVLHAYLQEHAVLAPRRDTRLTWQALSFTVIGFARFGRVAPGCAAPVANAGGRGAAGRVGDGHHGPVPALLRGWVFAARLDR